MLTINNIVASESIMIFTRTRSINTQSLTRID